MAIAIDAWLVSQRIHVDGARTITVNGELCKCGRVYVDPSGFVIEDGERLSGRGPVYERWNRFHGPKNMTRSGTRYQAFIGWNRKAECGGVTGMEAKSEWCDTEREALISVFEKYDCRD